MLAYNSSNFQFMSLLLMLIIICFAIKSIIQNDTKLLDGLIKTFILFFLIFLTVFLVSRKHIKELLFFKDNIILKFKSKSLNKICYKLSELKKIEVSIIKNYRKILSITNFFDKDFSVILNLQIWDKNKKEYIKKEYMISAKSDLLVLINIINFMIEEDIKNLDQLNIEDEKLLLYLKNNIPKYQ